MKMIKRQARDPLLLEIEQELRPGRFIRYDDMFDFTRRLDQVEEKLQALVVAGDADRAVRLYEMFLAGCYEKIEECDDSGGYFGMFWDTLFCGWVKARQAAGRPAAETVEQILKWKESDKYGFCYDIEKEVAKVLDADAYEALVAHFRRVVDDGLAKLHGVKPTVIFEYDNSIRLPTISLKDIYHARGDVASYASLCERIGFSPKDCEHLTEMEKAKRHWKQALAWIEKGLGLESTREWHNETAISLRNMKPEILSHLGRKEDALAQSWADFEKHPCDFSYKTFMRYVPKADRIKWHDRAMEVGMTGDIGQFMGLCVETREWNRLAARVRATDHGDLEAVSHYCAEVAAKGLAKHDAAAAAKVCRAMGFRILNAKKSKYYDGALANFETARDLYRKVGMESEWGAVINKVRVDHARKHGFMPGFERIVSGGSVDGPSFVERAEARWRKLTGSETLRSK